jgi:glycosyltransferase involved in cell wall biosynthesis
MSARKNDHINIAFEISPLLLASGSFGDKSGVYRYYYGLIQALGAYIRKNKKNIKIILFSFNKSLLGASPNKDILNLLNNGVFVFINYLPEENHDHLLNLEIFKLLFKPFLTIINTILPIKVVYFNIINNIIFNKYLGFLNQELKKNKVGTIYHSETGFFPIGNYKNIITIFDLTPIIMPYSHRIETNDLTQRKLNFAQKHCDGIVCISKSTKRDLLKYYPKCIHKKIMVCYPGLDPVFKTKINQSLFEDIKTLSKTQSIGLKSKRYLLYYGTFEPRKNIINLVQGFVELKQENKIPKDFKLILLGGDGWGKIKQTVSNYVKENFIIKEKNSIIIFDYLNDLYLISLIKNSYAVAYPSFYEGFGLPVLESMALGVPVITSTGSSLPEVGGQSVLYINPKGYDDLKDKMSLLINNPKLASQLSKKGFRRAGTFNWGSSASKLYRFLKHL